MRRLAAATMLAVLASQPLLAALPLQGQAAPAAAPDPSNLAPAEIPDDAVPVMLTLMGSNGLSEVFQMFGDSSGSSDVPKDVQGLLPYLSAYWVTDKEIQWKGSTYMVAYAPNISSQTFMSLGRATGYKKALDVRFHQVLINRAAIVTVTPREDLSKAKLVQLQAALQKVGDQGDMASALSNIKQIGVAALIYSNDYDDLFPNAHSTGQAEKEIEPYLKNKELYRSLNPNGGQILYNVNLAGVASTALGDASKVPMFYDSAPWPDGGHPVVFADSHVKYVDAAGWPAIVLELGKKYKAVPKAKPVGKAKG